MEKIRFITDSASDMNSSREDVTILPLHIRFGEEEYADGVTISHKEFYEKLIECDTLPTTSLVSPAVFEEAYEKAVSAGETVIVVTISSKLSGTCQTGDYITLKDGRKKTVKAYMIDEKIPRELRDRVTLLAEDHHVLWIVGWRISEYYKVTEDTDYVLEVQADGGRENG